MNIENYITTILEKSIAKLDCSHPLPIELKLERPLQEEHGDYSTNVALLLSKLIQKNALVIAQEILSYLSFDTKLIEKIECAGPGFINFFLGMGYYQDLLTEIIKQDDHFGRCDWGKGEKVQIEFVSANPTGPLNVVSARAAAVGDMLVNILNAVGYNSVREYYINDAGKQILLFGKSISSYYMKQFNYREDIPEDGYHGAYIQDIAKAIAEEQGDIYCHIVPDQRHEQLAKLGLSKMVSNHQQMMSEYGINFEHWFYESQLRHTNEHQYILEFFKEKNVLYEEDGAIWFKSKEFGDDKNRVLVTKHGEPTYFLIDIAYHKNKFDRGFDKIIDLWGPDHHGYIPRMKAALIALGYNERQFRFEIIQQVNLLRDGETMKMSKRAGKIIEMKELIDEVGRDAARFFFVNRKMSSHLDFDIELAKKQSEDNPVYYVQYAHARICSILNYAKEQDKKLTLTADLSLLNTDEEKKLIKSLALYPEIILKSAQSYEPYILTNYLQKVAAFFHHFYHYHRVVTDHSDLTRARLCLAKATQIVFANALRILGISAPEKM